MTNTSANGQRSDQNDIENELDVWSHGPVFGAGLCVYHMLVVQNRYDFSMPVDRATSMQTTTTLLSVQHKRVLFLYINAPDYAIVVVKDFVAKAVLFEVNVMRKRRSRLQTR